ncbi:hypothetical protein EMPS_05517 [Entomortierella parvispora]|uniref:Centrosomin N-terminal motif 1 domain-containing protein n=1 Tax=Entomortierella parvispora TaxID=205924 RepID=A0A9P3HAL3_9FUNG|nr:hypothetical protein EMPS_05517 [Entomortierella parvispora]
MDHGKWTASPDQSSLLMVQSAGATAHQGGFGLEYEDEDGEESRLDFNFEAIDADIDLDDSMQSSLPNSTNPRMLASLNGGHASSLGGAMTDSGELVGGGTGTAPGMGVPRSQKTIDRWSAGSGKPATMTLKEQEKVIDELKKESFSLKLKIYFLEERLAKISPEHVDQALQENIDMKVKLQTMNSELKQYKRLLLEAQAVIDSLQQQLSQKSNCDLQHGMTAEQEQDYKKAMAERLELRSLLEKLDDQVQALQGKLADKEQELDQMQSNHAMANEYEAQLDELRNQLLEYQKNETRLLEQSKMDEQWEIRCRELERELGASLDIRSELEQELLLVRSEKEENEDELGRQLEQLRDELSKAKIDNADIAHDLEESREQLRHIQEVHANDMNALSERWTLDRQEFAAQTAEIAAENEELRKSNEQLEAQAEDLMAWRNEDAERHDQELEDLVGELQDKVNELEALSQETRELRQSVQPKDDKIAELQELVEQLQYAQRESDAIHDEVIARMKSKMHSGQGSLEANGVSLQDFQLMSEELVLIEEQNRKLQTQLRAEIDHRIAFENGANNDREMYGVNNNRQWQEERHRLQSEYTAQINELQEKYAEASDQIIALMNDLSDRDAQLRDYEEQLDFASKHSKEIEERYDDMELKLSSDLKATTDELMEIRQEFEQIKASRVEKGDLLHSRTNEVDRLNIKTRKLNSTMVTLETEKEQLETALKDRAMTIAMLRSRLSELEFQVTQKQRDEDSSDETSKSDLVERNSLLLTVLQHLESILGGDSRLDGNMLPKPSANFIYFSNHLISRLKSLSKLFVLFEKKGKELEDKSTGQLIQLKKQLDLKLKQLDRFETIVRSAADRQKKWREQLVKKQAENEDLQAKHAQFARTIADLKARQGSSERSQDYEVRCKHAERKLQLEKSRSVDAEERWNARLRELEKRTKDAEERVQRERQGAKEKVAGLLDENKIAQRNLETLQRKNEQLQDLVDNYRRH